MIIKPAVIPKSLEDFEDAANFAKGKVPMIHIDMCDGIYVPSKSWPFLNQKGMEEMKAFIKGEAGLPGWEELEYEVDLMVANPLEVMNAWLTAGASSFVVHAEKLESDVFEQVLQKAHELESSLIISFNPGTDINKHKDFLEKSDGIQLMGIGRIGYQGEDFDERVFDQIKIAKEISNGNKKIQIDGAVNIDTKEDLVNSGADILVVGSGIFNDSNPQQALESLLQD